MGLLVGGPWTRGVQADWQRLAEGAGPTLTPEWAGAWRRAYGSEYDVHPSLLEHRAGQALLPLAIPRRHPWRLELLSARELAEPMDVLAPDAESVQSLARALAQDRANLFLRRIPAESPLVPAIQQAYRRRGAVVVGATAPSPVLPIDASWDEPERHMSKRRRSDMRRARRRAEDMGKVQYHVVQPYEEELDAHLDEFVAVESAGWKGRTSTALAHQSKQQQFFRAYAHAAARNGELRLSFLRIDNRVAAAQLAVHRAGALWLLKIGYDETFARCSPGSLLLLESVTTAAAEGARSVEFLGQSKPWTARWTTTERSYVRVLAYSRTAQSLPCLAEDAVRFARHVVRQRRDAVGGATTGAASGKF